MSNFIFATVLLSFSVAFTNVAAASEVLKPVKISKKEIAGSIFSQKGAKHEKKDGTEMSDVVTFTSSDSAFQTGIYKSGPHRDEIKGPPGLPLNEFLYFLSGSVTITSGDGSVMTVKAGEAVSIPRGWTGVFETTSGYTKLYVTYNPDDIK